jgi:hypothetical protein
VSERDKLINALYEAVAMVYFYESEVRSYKDGKLVKEGFCQGTIPLNARRRILTALDGGFRPFREGFDVLGAIRHDCETSLQDSE